VDYSCGVIGRHGLAIFVMLELGEVIPLTIKKPVIFVDIVGFRYRSIE
jgi:hypothetical protein